MPRCRFTRFNIYLPLNAPILGKSHLRKNLLKTRALILKTHVRNEDFLRDLSPIWGLYVVAVPVIALGMWLQTNTKGEVDQEQARRVVRLVDGLSKEMTGAFFDLLKKWPNAVWIFFPDSGPKGMIKLWRCMYGREFPSQRIKGNTAVGTAKRLRYKETVRAFEFWDRYREGEKPITIASTLQSKRPKSNLMTVLRAIRRAHRLIYGAPLPTDRRKRRLTGFDPATHMQNCKQCKVAYKEEDPERALTKMCQKAKDYLDEGTTYLREKLEG